MTARVVNVKHDDCQVYIGRTMPYTDWQNRGWGNPYTVKRHGLAESLRLYEAWVRGRPALMARLPSLRGKVLGCWCVPPGGLTTFDEPLICHGQVVLKLLAELEAR